MKKYLIIIAVALTSCHCLNRNKNNEGQHQNSEINNYRSLKDFKGDSLRYINQNFIGDSSEFAGKTLDVLLNKLELTPTRFLAAIGGSPYTTYVAVSLLFFNDFEVDKRIKNKENPMIMVVHFQTPVDSDKMGALLKKSNNKWDEKLFREYLGREKVKKIMLVK